MEVAPASGEVDDRYNVVMALRKELLDDSRDNVRDSTHKASLTSFRTVDGPTLLLLKSPNYPFSLCEEAPSSYTPPPVPFQVEEEIVRLKELMADVQEALEDEKLHSKSSPEDVQAVLNDSISYQELAWGVSSLQWFHRWVLSHSVSMLWSAREQLEYVLTDDGQALPSSVEEIDRCTERCPFPMAVDRLEKDRKSVIQHERSRLRSTSRTFREHVPTSVVTAAATPYMSAEEKYIYQEIFNETEHRMQTFYLSRMKERASRGNTTIGSGKRSSSSMVRPSGGSFIEPDFTSTTSVAFRCLEEEEQVLRELISTIREREASNVRFDTTEAEREASRTAQITVYGCLLSDEKLMAGQVGCCRDFLTSYEEWLNFYGFPTHEDLMEQLASMCGENGKWPSVYAMGNHHHHQHHQHEQSSLSQSVSQSENQASFHGQTGHSGISSVSKVSGPSLSTSTAEQRSIPDELFHILLYLVNQNVSSQPSPRMWWVLALRHAVASLVHRAWDPADFVRNSARMEDELVGLVKNRGGGGISPESAAVLIQIIRCFCDLCITTGSPAGILHRIEVAVPLTNSFELSCSEAVLWAAMLDSLWLQVSPQQRCCEGFLVDASSTSYFLSLVRIQLGSGSCRLLYSVAESSTQLSCIPLRQVEKAYSWTSPIAWLDMTVDIFTAVKALEEGGLFQLYGCRLEEVSLCSLIDATYVCFASETPQRIWGVSFLPPPALQLARFAAGAQSLSSTSCYETHVNLSTLGLQCGELLCFLGESPFDALAELYYFGETLREQASWEISNRVLPHYTIGTPSSSLWIDVNALRFPVRLQTAHERVSPSDVARQSAKHSTTGRSAIRYLSVSILRQLSFFLHDAAKFRTSQQ